MPRTHHLFYISSFELYESLFIYSLVFFVGACLGSFCSAISHRVPRGESWIFDDRDTLSDAPTHRKSGRSQCPVCNHKLSFADLVPVLSWLRQKGRCRYCGARISAFYPLVEITSALLCVLIVSHLGIGVTSLLLMLTVPFMLSLIVIDLRYYKLPSQLVAAVAVLGIIHAVLTVILLSTPEAGMAGWAGHILMYLFALIVYAILAFLIGQITGLIMGRASLGFGDVKLFGACGLWLGIGLLPIFLIFAGGYGIVLGFLWQKLTGKKLFPFGPAIILAFYTCFLFGGNFASF